MITRVFLETVSQWGENRDVRVTTDFAFGEWRVMLRFQDSYGEFSARIEQPALRFVADTNRRGGRRRQETIEEYTDRIKADLARIAAKARAKRVEDNRNRLRAYGSEAEAITAPSPRMDASMAAVEAALEAHQRQRENA